MRARALWLSALPAATVLRIRDRRAEREKIRAQVDGELRPAVLYITYDGLMEPLGQSQVLPYLRGLASEYAITILSFEKPNDLANLEQRKTVEEQLEKAAIGWIPLRYHKRPSAPATAFDIAHGVIRCVAFALRRHPQIVHVRGYVPGVIGLTLKRVAGVRLIFDMRGFWPDEKVDAGAWRRDSLLYRAAKRVEKSLLQRADVVVSLTQAGVTEMKKFPYLRMQQVRYEVIPTCTDLELFHPTKYSNNRGQKEFVLGYVGSVGTFYVFDEVLECYKELLHVRPDASLLIVNRDGHGYIDERLTALDVPREKVELHTAEYREVPEYIHRMDAGAFFVKPTFSKKSSAPTRLGEFLGCGVPCLVNAGVGDMDVLISKDRVGVVMREFSPQARSAAIRELLKLSAEDGIRKRCVEVAHRRFALDQGLTSYRRIYRVLLGAGKELEAAKWSAEGSGIGYDGE